MFTQYAEFGGMLRAHLAARFGREVLFLHGGVAKADRDAMVARFQADDASAPPLFVLSLKAGGTGLNLTAANHVVHVDRWWNPAVEDQATDRAFRIGQTPQRAGPQVRLRRHGGGEDRRDDRARSGAWPRRSSAPARAGSPSCPHRSCATCSRSSAEAVVE